MYASPPTHTFNACLSPGQAVSQSDASATVRAPPVKDAAPRGFGKGGKAEQMHVKVWGS